MDYLLPFLFLLIAFIYSSVGLGGGSSYTALMAIFGISYQIIPTTSLTMNLIVTFISMIHFWKNGHGRLNLIIPFFNHIHSHDICGRLIGCTRNIF